MSMISEQVKELREKAQIFEDSGCATNGIVKTFRKAADTIEKLSAKLATESQPPADQWIPCSERLPKDGQTVPVTVVLWEEKRILSHATYHTEKPEYWHPYDWNGEGFYIYISELGECKYKDVIAWLNVEPYKEVE